jgi:hypothetical protein
VDVRTFDLRALPAKLGEASVELPLQSYSATALSTDGKTFAYSTTVPGQHAWQSTKHLVASLDLEHLAAGPRVLPYEGAWYEHAVGFVPETGELLVGDGGTPDEYGLHVLGPGARERRWKMPAAPNAFIPIAGTKDVWVITVEAIHRFHS